MKGVLVLGIGNMVRGDDAAGRLVARRLKARELPAEVEVVELRGELASLVEAWSGHGAVVVVDAMRSGAAPGHVGRFDVASEPLPAGTLHCSTHAMGLAEAIELSRAMGELPERCVIVGIEGVWFEQGAALTEAVAEALDEAVDVVMAQVGAWI